jgi:hypothetical protein
MRCSSLRRVGASRIHACLSIQLLACRPPRTNQLVTKTRLPVTPLTKKRCMWSPYQIRAWPRQASSFPHTPLTVIWSPSSSTRSYVTPRTIWTPRLDSVSRCTHPDVLPSPAPTCNCACVCGQNGHLFRARSRARWCIFVIGVGVRKNYHGIDQIERKLISGPILYGKRCYCVTISAHLALLALQQVDFACRRRDVCLGHAAPCLGGRPMSQAYERLLYC